MGCSLLPGAGEPGDAENHASLPSFPSLASVENIDAQASKLFRRFIMPFTLIKGAFRPDLGTPDGDSVRFLADDFALFQRLDGKPAKKLSQNTVQLRYEGIDALEKNAILPFSADATKTNIAQLTAALPGVPPGRGYILARQTDDNRRPISFVFAGDPPEADGAEVFLDAVRVRDSVNYRMIAAGYAYPMFYITLFKELRDEFVAALLHARAQGLGYWPADQTQTGVTFTGASSLKTLPPIFPKLFRRLEEYNNADLSGFRDSLKPERLLTISTSQFLGFEEVVAVNGNTVLLTRPPEDLIFVPAQYPLLYP
jgi:hypothetical protein